MDPPAKNTSETGCRSHKGYLNSWVTEIGGCERIQTNVNSSVFGVDYLSPTADCGQYKIIPYVLAILYHI
jgi:hypothetical protein